MTPEKEQLIAEVSDFHKYAYGFRPYRYDGYRAMTIAQLEAETKYLAKVANQRYEQEMEFLREMKARKRKEKADTVKACLNCGAPDWETAKRWAKEAYA